MILGKIEVRVENIGGKRYFYCRPVSNGNGRPFPTIIGTAHVVHLEKCDLTNHLIRNDVITVYGIFSNIPTENDFLRGYINLKVSPITEDMYEQLKLIYSQAEHPFLF